MSSQRFEGKNLDEALDSASTELGVDRTSLSYSVVEEKRGFLGAIKKVVIEAVAGQMEAGESISRPASPVGVGPEREELQSDQMEAAAPPRRQPSRRGEPSARGVRKGGGSSAEIPAQGEESELAGRMRLWCEELLELAGWRMEVRSSETDDKLILRLYGADAERFTERTGELLDSIQIIVNKSFISDLGEKRAEVDCADFRNQRSSELETLARDLADQVRRDKREQLLPAMNPMERRIVHVALHDDGEVETESRGEGFFKRVAIIPRRAVSAQEP